MVRTVVFKGISDRAWPQINVNVWMSLRGRETDRSRETERQRKRERVCETEGDVL